MKLRNIIATAAGSAAVCAAASVMAEIPATPDYNAATPAPLQSQVQAHLRMEIKDDVKEVHFINTNNDPYVYSKVYILKNADPYEIQPYLTGAVGGYWDNSNTYNSTKQQGRRVETSNTNVNCIKYMDGTGALIVSAEDYRFSKGGNENGMSIDDLIAILDQPQITSSSGQPFNLYFPKYQTAAELEASLNRVGLNGNALVEGNDGTGNQWELDQGKDRIRKDNYLNALLIYTPGYSIKSYQQMLEQYDKPNPEVVVNYTVYEYDNEIDSQVGNDFQAWKNGPGTDLFAAGARFTNGWDIANMNVARNNGVGSNTAKYINFNPKWNTKYLDLLASKSYAKIVTAGSLSLYNNKVGTISSTIQFPIIKDGTTVAPAGITEVAISGSINVTGATAVSGLMSRNGVTVTGFSGASTLKLYRYKYQYTSGSSATLLTDYFFEAVLTNNVGVMAGGENLGSDVILLPSAGNPSSSVPSVTVGSAVSFTVSSNYEPTAMAMQHAPPQVSDKSSLGFSMTVGATASGSAPVLMVCETTTTVPITMTNTNLIGFTSNGTPRTSLSTVSSVVVVNNKGEKFVVGGLEKETVIRSANKVPYLGDIPGLGWALGNERETHKKSQLVAVLDIIPVLPDTAVAANIMGEIAKDKEFIGNYGVKNSVFDENDYGYDQFLLDSDKKSFDPLP